MSQPETSDSVQLISGSKNLISATAYFAGKLNIDKDI